MMVLKVALICPRLRRVLFVDQQGGFHVWYFRPRVGGRQDGWCKKQLMVAFYGYAGLLAKNLKTVGTRPDRRLPFCPSQQKGSKKWLPCGGHEVLWLGWRYPLVSAVPRSLVVLRRPFAAVSGERSSMPG
jgi:hypothetical protein